MQLILAFPCSFSLLFAFYAGLLIVFAFSHFGEDAGLLSRTLKTTKRTVNGFSFANSDLSHLYPSLHDLFREV